MDETSDANLLGDEEPFLLRLSEDLTIHQPRLACSMLSISYPVQLRPFYASHLVIEGVNQFGSPFTDYGNRSVQMTVQGMYESSANEMKRESLSGHDGTSRDRIMLTTQTRNASISLTRNTNFEPILSPHALYYSLLPLADVVDASCLSLSISCVEDGEEKRFSKRIPVTLGTNVLLSNLVVNITVQPKEYSLSAEVTLVDPQHIPIPMDDYRGIFLISQRSNRSISHLAMNQGNALTLNTELPFAGDTLITLFVQDPEGRTLQVSEQSVTFPDRTPTTVRVFGRGLFAPSLVDSASSCYEGIFFLQYYAAERDSVPCSIEASSFRLSLSDKASDKPIPILYSVGTNGSRCVISYNFTGTRSSYILSLSRDSLPLYRGEFLLADASLTHSVSFRNIHPFLAMENETMASSHLSNGVLLRFTSPILDIGVDSISLLCDEGYTESSFLIRREGVNSFRAVPMIPSSGVYVFRVFLFNLLLEQTLSLEIQPNTAEQTTWLFWGSGVAGGQTGERLVVNARKQDMYSNTIPVATPRLHVYSSEQRFSVTGEDVGNHIQFFYSISSLPSNATWTSVSLSVETSAENVTVTPLFRSIFITAGAVDWSHSVVWGATEVFAGELYSFHLTLRDAFSNHLPPGFGSYGLTITGEN